MTWSSRVVDDLRQPEAPTRGDELPFMIASAAVIVLAAQLTEPDGVAELLWLMLAGAAFVARGFFRRPPTELFAAVVVVGVGAAITPNGALEVGLFLVVFEVLYAAWHLGSTIRAVAILVVSAATPWFVVAVFDADLRATPWIAACVFTFALGRNLRRQRLLIEELEATQQALAAQAVHEERRRMARELHDLAGHTLAAMMLHVTGARHVLRRDVDDAEQALLDAEAIGHASLDQMRATVAALRTDESGTDAPVADSSDLQQLVDDYRRAGLRVTTDWTAEALSINGPVGTAMHRIAREALANVARHASGNSVEIVLELVDEPGGRAVRIEVSDHGRQPATQPRPGGFGIVGMRERARALGGEMAAGPTTDGWSVQAVLPVAAPAGGSWP